jgi:predicted house-cleaning noncanonical NTP pyrophosphatase (MazG superfamily)
VTGRPYLVKLVRDHIGEMLPSSKVSYEPVPADKFLTLMRRKVREEAIEYTDDPCLRELADVYEALRCAADAEGWTMFEIEREVERKYDERGGFNDGMGMWVTTTAEIDHDG